MFMKMNFFDEIEFCIEKDKTATMWECFLGDFTPSVSCEYVVKAPEVALLHGKPCIIIETQFKNFPISEVEDVAKRLTERFEMEEYAVFVTENKCVNSIIIVSESYLNDEDVSVINRVIESEVEDI